MNHLSEEQLVWFHYGEDDGRERVAEHLSTCAACRKAYEDLENTLAQMDAVSVPERGEDYGAEVWNRVRPRLSHTKPPRWEWLAWLFPWPGWARAASVAALVTLAFFLGRFWPRAARPVAQPIAAEARERILLVAIGDHLERSQTVLLELVNTKPEEVQDISGEQRRAEDLIAANRLYRQSAARSGDAGIASVLEELERVLIEIARGRSRLSAADLEQVRQRIESGGILFRVRVIDSQLREREESIRRGS